MRISNIATFALAFLAMTSSAMAGSICNCEVPQKRVVKKVKTSGCGGGTTVTITRSISYSGNKCRFGSMWAEDLNWIDQQGNGTYKLNIQTKSHGSCTKGFGTIRVRVTDSEIRVLGDRAECGKGRHAPYRV